MRRASAIVSTLGTEYVAIQADTFGRLVQGQVAETRGPEDGDDPVAHYLDVVADKTGSLIATSAQFGDDAENIAHDQRGQAQAGLIQHQ